MPFVADEETEEKLLEIRQYLREGLSEQEICKQVDISPQTYSRWIRKYKFQYNLHRLLPEDFRNDDEISKLLKNTKLLAEQLLQIFKAVNSSCTQREAERLDFPDLTAKQKYFIVYYIQKRLLLSEINACAIIGQNWHEHRKIPRQLQKEHFIKEYEEKLRQEIRDILNDKAYQALSRFKSLNALDNLSLQQLTKHLKQRGFDCPEEMIYKHWKEQTTG